MTWWHGGQRDRLTERWNGIRNPAGGPIPATTGAKGMLSPGNAGNVLRPKARSRGLPAPGVIGQATAARRGRRASPVRGFSR